MTQDEAKMVQDDPKWCQDEVNMAQDGVKKGNESKRERKGTRAREEDNKEKKTLYIKNQKNVTTVFQFYLIFLTETNIFSFVGTKTISL